MRTRFQSVVLLANNHCLGPFPLSIGKIPSSRPIVTDILVANCNLTIVIIKRRLNSHPCDISYGIRAPACDMINSFTARMPFGTFTSQGTKQRMLRVLLGKVMIETKSVCIYIYTHTCIMISHVICVCNVNR